MTYNSNNNKSIIRENQSAPSLSANYAIQQGARESGLFAPEQQSFLGASITNFSVQNGDGSNPSSLSVELVEDPDFNNYVNEISGVGGFEYDPYHNGSSDIFNPPAVGMPVFFVYATPRAKIKDAFYPAGALPDGESIFKFGGLLQSFHQTNSVGGRTFSVTVSDPREILSNIYLILNHSDTKVGEVENNVFNVFGFLEYNPTDDTRTMFNGYTSNVLRRSGDGTQFAGDDMYYSAEVPSLPANQLYPTHYFENTGYATKFPITGTAMSRRGSYGMPYYRIMQGLSAMSATLPNTEYSGFSGGIYYRGMTFNLVFNGLPPVPPMYCFDQDNTDLLSFLIEIADASGREISVSLRPSQTNSSTSFSGGDIIINFIDRTMESSVGQIRSFIKNNVPQSKDALSGGSSSEFSQAEKEDIGYEATNPETGKIVFGGNRVDLYAFTSNHDDGRYFRINNSQVQSNGSYFANNQFLPYYGKLSENVFSPVRGSGDWRQILLDASGLGAFGVGNYYITTEVELRYAAKNFKAWKSFLDFFNNKYLTKLVTNPRARYQDVFRDGGQLRVQDSDGLRVRGLKVPRCLFTNDTGFANGMPKNPCSPPFGFPLYYGRSNAIGLSLDGLIDPRFSVLADLNRVKQSSGEDIQVVANYLIDKYTKLRNLRGISEAEEDLLESLEEGNFNPEYLQRASESLSKQVYTAKSAEFSKNRKENVQKIYNFVRSVATQCYGKKFLVRIPNKPNYKFDSNTVTGVELDDTKGLYKKGYFGFPPRSSVSGSNLNGAAGGDDVSFVYNSNDTNINGEQSKFHRALITNYNPIDAALAHNFTPNAAGGFLTKSAYATGLKSALIPRDLSSFGTSYRIQGYARYDHAEYLNIPSTDCYTEKVGDDVNRKNAIPNKIAGTDEFDAQVSGETMLGFMPIELDEKYYFPAHTVSRTVKRYGTNLKQKNHYVAEAQTPDEDGKLPENANLEKIIELIPNYKSNHTQSIVDFPRDGIGKIIPYPDTSRAYALITLPEKVTVKRDNVGDIPIRNHFKAATYINHFGDDASINTVTHVKTNKRLDFANQGASLTFFNPNRLFSSPKGLPPDVVVLPLENEQACYGPWYTGPVRVKNDDDTYSYKVIKNSGGKVNIEMDESLTPWNFGSYELMNVAGMARTEVINTLYFASEKGSITFPGMPFGIFEIGDIAANSGPILDSISFDIGVGGVHTSYRFQTYTRSFGAMKKQQQKSLDLMKTQSLKAGKANFDLFTKGLIKSKFSGALPKRQFKPYDSFYEEPSTSTTDTEVVSLVPVVNPADPRGDSSTKLAAQAANVSSEGMQASIENSEDITSLAEENYNSAIKQSSDGKVVVSMEPHASVPSVDIGNVESLESLYQQPTDTYDLENINLSYWRT